MDLLRKKSTNDSIADGTQLAKCLSVFDLVFLGVGAIIGAGIFVLTGIAAATQAGPAIVYSYILAGLACTFSALSYAELAASIGGCGSAYGYAYVGFGELIAWIVGWDLILEYTVSVSAVSVGWSGYCNDFLKTIHVYLPDYLLQSTTIGGAFNLLSVIIILFLTGLSIWGVKSSSRFNNVMVLVKLAIVILFIVVAIQNVNSANWTPFMPFGWQGVMNGASLIFFAYIGFDAVSTAAEEAINPQRDLPIGIMASLAICTVLYIVVAGLLTGITPYTALNNPSPISHTMLSLGYSVVASLISVGAIMGLTTVMLVLFYGLTRVFLAMARDGLLPNYFAHINQTTQTPIRIILLAGVIMACMAGVIPMDDLAQLVNIGTLFAFIVVCAGVLILRYTRPDLPRPFKTPGMPVVPILGILSCSYLISHLAWFTIWRFIIWMALGLVVYFCYSRSRSHLHNKVV